VRPRPLNQNSAADSCELAHDTRTTSCQYSTQLSYKTTFSHGNSCQKKFLAYKSIRVIRGHEPQVNLLYNVVPHSALSSGPSRVLHRFADTDNGTGDQTYRIPHNASPDVASVIASCRPGLERRGGQVITIVWSFHSKNRNAYSGLQFQGHYLQFSICSLLVCWIRFLGISLKIRNAFLKKIKSPK
jgi:hypothetical protein